ncbi:right-handed parallel beta-helix repeat-containing protein [Anaerobaca lacustris]|uniref:Right-handed parallel beta-helix repeat-containing protein n=1 Tax=Anaerobaca lacustris TaxID=3044600 RepID=A0AAW6TWL9_9BACT|nr:right-handed parallel beta-helix repeat-containing protein [Sedimentisphaerales bacterium M17dextr]
MTLRGGYAGIGTPDPNARDVNDYPTVLTGDLKGNDLPVPAAVFRKAMPIDRLDNVANVVKVVGDHVVIDGFTIRGGLYSIIPRGESNGGAGMLILGHEVKVASCIFEDNATTTGWGGAVYVGPVCHVEIVESTFSNNYGGGGGALCCHQGHVSLYACEFIQNYSPSSGGAVAGWLLATVAFEDSVFIGNTAMSLGGAVFGDSYNTTLTFTNSLFAGNLARMQGGAVAAGAISLKNCTIADNRAAGNPEIRIETDGLSELANCIVWKNEKLSREDPNDSDWLGTCFYCCLDPNAVATRDLGNIDQDPAFAMPGYWDPNGTPDDFSDDIFVEGDYHLKSQAGRWNPNSESWVADDVTSPCIDAGDPNSPIGHEPFPNGGIINMGAYGGTAEASMSISDIVTTLD